MGEPAKKLSKSPSQWLSFWSKNAAPSPGPTRPTPTQSPRRPPQAASSPPSGKEKPPTVESQKPSSSNPSSPPQALPESQLQSTNQTPSAPNVTRKVETEKVAPSGGTIGGGDGGGDGLTQPLKGNDEFVMSSAKGQAKGVGAPVCSTQKHSSGSEKHQFSEEPSSKALPNESKLELTKSTKFPDRVAADVEMNSQENVSSPKLDKPIPNRSGKLAEASKSSVEPDESEIEVPKFDRSLDGDRSDGKNSDMLTEETNSYESNLEPVPKVESRELEEVEIGKRNNELRQKDGSENEFEGKEKIPRPKSDPPLNPLVAKRESFERLPEDKEAQKSCVHSNAIDANNNGPKARSVSITKNGKRGITGLSCDQQENLKEDLSGSISSLVQNLGLEEKLGTKNGICVITLAGDNKGASMVVGEQSSSIPIQSNHIYPRQEKNTEMGDTNARGNSSRAKEKVLVSTNVNSNSQGVNNSILNDSSCHERDAGVHFVVTTSPPEDEAIVKGGTGPSSTEKSRAIVMRNEAPTVRRRCLRALFMEDNDGEEEDKNKKGRIPHGCKYKCGDIDGKFGM